MRSGVCLAVVVCALCELEGAVVVFLPCELEATVMVCLVDLEVDRPAEVSKFERPAGRFADLEIDLEIAVFFKTGLMTRPTVVKSRQGKTVSTALPGRWNNVASLILVMDDDVETA
jgi:hypothetical protein